MSQQPRSLLIITPSLHVGGTETHLLQILPGLKANGWEVSIFLTSAIGALAEPLSKAGINIVKPDFLNAKLHNKSRILRAPLLLFTFLRMSWYLHKNKPNITMFMLPEAYIVGGLSCLLTGQNNLVMNRRSLNNYQQKYGLISKLEHWLHTKMTRIITNSSANIQQLIHEEKVPEAKIQLIYNGIDAQRFRDLEQANRDTIRAEFNLAPSSFTMVIIANLIPYKGHITLLNALALIKAQLPLNWQLLCVGHLHQPFAQELIERAAQLNLTEHIHWLGAQSAIPKLLAISDLAVSSSYEEGFSNSVLECMAAGLPLVVTDVGGNPEAVLNNVNGLVVPAKDADALSKAILELAVDPAFRKTFGQASKQRVEANFSQAKCISEYDKLFSSIC